MCRRPGRRPRRRPLRGGAGLSLRVVEIGGYGDDRLFDALAEVPLGAFLERLQHHRRDFRRCDFAAADGEPDEALAGQDAERQIASLILDVLETAAHEALDGVNGVGRSAGELAPGGLAHHDAVGRKRDDGRQQRSAVGVRNDARQPRRLVHVGDQAVRRPQVNADDAR